MPTFASRISSCSRWTIRSAKRTHSRRSPTAKNIRNGASACRPTSCLEFRKLETGYELVELGTNAFFKWYGRRSDIDETGNAFAGFETQSLLHQRVVSAPFRDPVRHKPHRMRRDQERLTDRSR